MVANYASKSHQPQQEEGSDNILDSQQTQCCVVGGGPAGAVLAFLLARQGVSVVLLEAHRDFDRDFRGDTLHPSVMNIMDELGLADRLLDLPHTKLRTGTLITPQGAVTIADFSRLKARFPYITLMPQVQFLEFIVNEAKQYPSFQLIMGANVQELIVEDDRVSGVRYRGHGGWREVRAELTVGADGRHSRLRQLAGFEALQIAPPMDVLWFRLPRNPKEPKGAMGRIGSGRFVVLLNRFDSWQVAYIFPKGGYQQIRAAGLEALRQSIVEVTPEFSDRIQHLQSWSQVAFLAVESSRLRRWHRPGLLLIGDAAHAMSPVGGVGINYAIQDAVVAANVLCQPLKAGEVQPRYLAAVQRQREWPTQLIQMVQSLVQKRIIAPALDPEQEFTPPMIFRLPILRDLPARLIGLGIWPVHVEL